jgi:hypothetical protein
MVYFNIRKNNKNKNWLSEEACQKKTNQSTILYLSTDFLSLYCNDELLMGLRNEEQK